MQYQEQHLRQIRPARQTLPRNFTFHYRDGPPKTPEPIRPRTLPEEPLEPPKLRIRRRRQYAAQQQYENVQEELPLPTIELPPDLTLHYAPVLSVRTSELQDDFLAPATARSLKRYGRIIEPPKTPLDQIFNAFDEACANGNEWTPHRPVEPISRASSVFSDSSESTSSSEDSSPSFEESCTSPDAELSEAFIFPQLGSQMNRLSSPLAFTPFQKPRKRFKLHNKTRWTADMDEHLWQTYTNYCADPTVTPFKMLPGTAPPLGVCHRVAREAKKTWRGPRPTLHPIAEDQQSQPYMSLDAALAKESSSPSVFDAGVEAMNAIQPQLDHRGFSANNLTRKALGKWPRSEASSRRRLRELCKRKPTLSPHYQRLMQPRSPSPFRSSSSKAERHSGRFASPPLCADADSVFATRDLNITLATSTASSMQPDGPLSQLAGDEQRPRPFSSDWNPRPASRSGAAHQKSQSLHLSLGLGSLSSAQLCNLRTLASPFQEPVQRQDWQQDSETTPQQLPALVDKGVISQQDLAADAQIHYPRPLSGSMKRRAQYQLAEELGSDGAASHESVIENLFHNQDTYGHRRVRSRGFSVGAVRHSAHNRHLSELFTPPTTYDTPATMPSRADAQQRHFSLEEQLRVPPPLGHVRRLGSPFDPSTNVRFSQTFPRSAYPQGLDSLSSLEQQQAHHEQPLESRFGSDGSLSLTVRRM